MRFFGGGGGEDEAARARREASEQSLKAGGLPLDAVDRLKHQAEDLRSGGGLFTGDLSVAELGLVGQVGYEPLGQVMGSSIYHIGLQWLPNASWGSNELPVLTKATAEARGLALSRLADEAELLGASGVVGVRVTRSSYEWGAALVEFTAVGTAVRERGWRPEAHRGQKPFLSDLSGQDFFLLRRAGYRAVGFAAGNCTYFQVANWRTRQATSGGIFGTGWANQELTDFTRGMYAARQRAVERMEHEAKRAGGEGVVGATLEVEVTPYERDKQPLALMYEMTALGTAIRAETGWAAPPIAGVVRL